jgi:TBC1 domain family protein 5
MQIFLLSRDQPLQPTAVAFTPNLYLSSNETSRNAYRDLLLEKMRAPDGSYDEGLHVPGLASSPPRHSSMSLNLNTNNPLSLDLQVRLHSATEVDLWN